MGEKVAPLESWMTIRWAICGQLHRPTWPVLTHVVLLQLQTFTIVLQVQELAKECNLIQYLNDPGMVRIDDNVVISGGAIINGHLVEKAN